MAVLPSVTWKNSATPVSVHFDDVYFSSDDGLQESRYVFFEPNQLQQRWQTHARPHFVIAETGFGTGLNFLMTWHAFVAQNHTQRLFFTSFEKFPLTPETLLRAASNWSELMPLAQALTEQYQAHAQGVHRFVFAQGRVVLDLWFGDLNETLPKVPQATQVDAWFLDGFNPSKNPDMWQPTLFAQMARLSHAATTYATFTAAGFVRRALQAQGFQVQKQPGYGLKREMIFGTYAAPAAQPGMPYAPRVAAPKGRIAILGAGIASAQCLLALQERQGFADVFCVEATVAGGASGNPQAAIYPLLMPNMPEISQWFVQAFERMRLRVSQLHRRQKFAYADSGVLMLGYHAAAQKKLQSQCQDALGQSVMTAVDATQASALAGVTLPHGGGFIAKGGWVDAAGFVQACFQQTKAQHQLHPHTEIVALRQEATGLWSLTDANGKTYGGYATVILANGAQVTRFAQTQGLPLTPVRGQLTQVPSQGALHALKTVICADGYLTPQHNRAHCLGASYNRGDLSLQFSRAEQQGNFERLAQSLQGAPWFDAVDQGSEAYRVSLRMNSRDHVPFVGAVPQAEALPAYVQKAEHFTQVLPTHQGLYMLTGLGSRGLSTAALAADVLISEIYGEPLPATSAQLYQLFPARMAIRQARKRLGNGR
jgi:tRNA 5-methylaminomethyl-2-thiouridine biosynthesis bifunctional protein